MPLLVALVAVAAAQVHPAPRFEPPDGHWWLAASDAEQFGFDIGQFDCDAFVMHHRMPAPNTYQFEHAITRYYRNHPRELALPLMDVVSRLNQKWAAERTYPVVKPNPAGEDDSDIWWNASPGNMDGIIRGFLACQAAEQGIHVQVPVQVIIRRVSRWYGVDPQHEGVTNPKTEHDKLSRVILRAEKPMHSQ